MPDNHSLTQTATTLMVGNCVFDITTEEGKMAARAYAWIVAAQGDEKTKREIIRIVGKDDG